MFYSAQILAKKGPLGLVWIAAHVDSRLKRTNVAHTSIPSSVDSILNPEAPLALRLSGQLLLGVVRIYNKQIIYLYEDCNETLSRVALVFKPEESRPVPATQIGMPDTYAPLSGVADEEDELDLGSVDLRQLRPFELSGGNYRLMTGDDGHAPFSSPLLSEPEQFEVGGEELERHLSMTPVEVMREAPEPEVQRLFDSRANEATPRLSMEEELLPAGPPGDDFFGGEPPQPDTAPPSSHTRSDLPDEPLFDNPLTPMHDEPVEMPRLELTSESPKRTGRERPAANAAARRKPGEKRRRVHKDLDANDRPATMLSSTHVRERLKDTQPILRLRPSLTAAQILGQGAASVQADEMPELWMQQSSLDTRMAPQLLALFAHISSDSVFTDSQTADAQQEDAGEPAASMQQPDTPLEAAAAAALQSAGVDPVDEGMTGNDTMDLLPGPDIEAAFDTPNAPDGVDGSRSTSARLMSPLSTPGSRRPSSSKRRAETDPGREDGVDSPNNSISFAARSQTTLQMIKARAQRMPGSKKARLSDALAASADFEELHAHGSRAEAARLFFDLLTLQAGRKVHMSQEEPYGSIRVALPGSG